VVWFTNISLSFSFIVVVFLIMIFLCNTDIKNQYMNLNNGDKPWSQKASCCNACWVPAYYKIDSWLPACSAAWINYAAELFSLNSYYLLLFLLWLFSSLFCDVVMLICLSISLIVTIVEIHMLILDVCVCRRGTAVQNFYFYERV